MKAALLIVCILVAFSLLCERMERASRKYYLDQALLRLSGFCLGAATTLLLFALLQG